MEDRNWKDEIDNILIGEKGYLDMKVTAGALAQRLGLSIWQMSRVMKRTYNTNFTDVLLSLRVEHAKQMLLNPDNLGMEMDEIWLRSGFGNRSTFFLAFKTRTGTSPDAYRRQMTRRRKH